MANAINFTKRGLETLSLPESGKRVTYQDTKTPGLSLRVTASGTKTFIVYRKVKGRPERVTLGRFPTITVEQARKLAAEANGAIARGENPNDKRRAYREEITLGGLFGEYMERHAKIHKRSWRGDQTQFERYLKTWRNRKLSHIRKPDVQALHSKIGRDHGPYAANRLLALLRCLFNRASDWGLWDKANPTQGIKKFREQARERFLEADEIPRFFQSLAEEPNTVVRDYFLISLLTGARRSNVQAMRYEQINFERGTWTIPQTKNGDQHILPLVPQALVILHERRAQSDSEWVFPGTGRTGHLVEPKTAWARILERAGIVNLRIHDLRRSLGSWQAATGASLSVIGKTLAHKNVSTTAIYARLGIDPVRSAMEIATNAIFDAAKVGEKAPVFNIKKANS